MNFKLYFLLAIYLFGLVQLQAQTPINTTLRSNVTVNDYSNDVWGYVDSLGNEYALMGGRDSTYIFDVTNPDTPVLIKSISGVNSIWRDLKTYNKKMYVVADQGSDGVLIADLSNLQDSVPYTFWHPTLQINGNNFTLDRCHNIYIDEDGFAYLSGCNIGKRGILIFDLNITPDTPTYVGIENVQYSHDVYVRDDLMYTSEVYKGWFGVYDITDKTTPTLLARQTTGYNFTHNTWLSDDSNILYTTDEKANAYVESYDISDLDNIIFLDRFQPLETQGTNTIPHNVHVLDSYLIISHYTDGIVIVDAAQPDNLIQVGSYDTWTGANGNFNGCWGAYPFLPSGRILASDIQGGLFVIDPDYERASYFRGMVIDTSTGLPIPEAEIHINSSMLNEASSNLDGTFATGVADTGLFQVVVHHPAYPSDTSMVYLERGVTATDTIYLGYINCVDTITHTGPIMSQQYFARDAIISSGTISSGGAVYYNANDEVRLEAPFEIESNSIFEVYMQSCN